MVGGPLASPGQGTGKQWRRCCRVTLGGSSGATITYDAMIPEARDGFGGPGLKINFRVTHAERAFPQNAVIAITNLKRETEQKFVKKEYSKVKLECGYEGHYETVFEGEIYQARLTTERMTDRITIVSAKDSPRAFSHGTVSQTLPEGSTANDQIQACLKAWKQFGVVAGQISDFGNQKAIRPRVLHGMVSDKLNEIAQTNNASWHVRGGKLHFLKNTETMDGTVLLTPSTGMVGRAEQTIQGVIFKCLLNPRIRPKTKVRIDESAINRGVFSPDYLAKNETMYPSISANGIYEVLDVDEVGDTRGQDWYTIGYCLSTDPKANIPIGLAPRGIGVLSGNDTTGGSGGSAAAPPASGIGSELTGSGTL